MDATKSVAYGTSRMVMPGGGGVDEVGGGPESMHDTTDGPRTAVELHGVVKRFGDRSGTEVTAVDNLDLAIADGEFFSLLGPSGCGKTTTLRMIASLELPTAGSIRIHGEEMGLRPPNKRPVNTVFQNYALFPHMTVAKNIGFGLEMCKVPAGERAELTNFNWYASPNGPPRSSSTRRSWTTRSSTRRQRR